MSIRTGRSARWFASLAVLTTSAIIFSGAGAAHATPGHPGTPDAGRVVFHEDFEKAPDTGLRSLLATYKGVDGRSYTADPYWMNAVKANGMILSWNNTKAASDATGSQNGSEDAAFDTLRQLSEAIGKVNGTTAPRTNSVISAYTQDKGTPPAGNQVMFATTEDIQLADSAGRFLAFSMTAAATNAKSATAPQRENPQLMFSVSQDGTETTLNNAPIDPLTDGRGAKVAVTQIKGAANADVYAGQYASDKSFLYDGGEFGIVIRNLTSAHLGNDGAFDDIKVLDVTPQLDKQFGQSEATTGDSVRLTFTVTNTAELANKKGWSFTDSLPAGLVVAADPDVVVDGTATVVADPGAAAITVSDGDLAAGDNALTISLNVTSHTAGSYTNGPSNITVRRGLDSPDSTTVTFTDPAPAPADLVVRYVDEAGKELAPSDVSDGTVGDMYDTTARVIPDYELVAVPANAAGTLGEGTTEVVYVYRPVPAPKVGDLVVRYVDEDGHEVAGTEHTPGTPGDRYTTHAKTIDGYTLTTDPQNADGTLVEGTIEVVYVYTKDPVAPAPADLVVRWVDEAGTDLSDRLDHTGLVGDSYTTEAKAFDGYVLVVTPGNAGGELTAITTTVTYVYSKVVAPVPAELTVRFVDTAGNPLAEATHRDGVEHDAYSTAPLEIPGYTLTAVPANASGEMVGSVEVVYVYTKDPVVPVTPPATPAAPVVPVTPEPEVVSQVLATPDARPAAAGSLAHTGSDAGVVAALAAGLAVAGAALVALRRRNSVEEG
ncbi:MucBP domain-containing protein [Cellulomonas terrae]|uniref:Gram-positive cocci surface proteins LPxTG domain-containing protein n=1 Tax=Cellulomonas terrae TaxID=311234 RepID=A0A511JJS7_9CELL|nr:MucBP domain-containing protein [Cellulomonas terrae]GEL98267.1 hypothetical protein CTE05_18140 [Cellulomonas terrae]